MPVMDLNRRWNADWKSGLAEQVRMHVFRYDAPGDRIYAPALLNKLSGLLGSGRAIDLPMQKRRRVLPAADRRPCPPKACVRTHFRCLGLSALDDALARHDLRESQSRGPCEMRFPSMRRVLGAALLFQPVKQFGLGCRGDS